METLRISPKYTAAHWKALDVTNPAHWPKAVRIVRDRLHGRFLHFADKCLKDDYSGFVVLAVDCLLAEALQQFIVQGQEKVPVRPHVLGQAGLDRVLPITGCDVLELYKNRPRVRLNHVSDGAAPHIGSMKPRHGNL